jgi:hypothetical protein
MLSYILLALSTVGACMSAARIPVMTGPFVANVVVMALAVILMRRSYRARIAREVSGAGRGKFDFLAAAVTVLASLDSLADRPDVSCGEIHDELDKLVDGPLFDFAEAREGLLAMHGFGEYARVVGEFSRGERAVNRAWSSAVDGYPEEARNSVKRARELFAELKDDLERLGGKKSE